MKPDEQDRIRKRTPPAMPDPPTPPGWTAGAPMGASRKSMHIPLVFVTTSPKDQADRGATESMIAQCLREGVYSCPRCDFTTTSPEAMVNHLAEEINKSLSSLNEILAGDESADETGTNPIPK